MIKCRYTKFGIPIEHIWFYDKQEEMKDSGIMFYHAVGDDMDGVVKVKNHSLITDLSMDENTLFQKIRKNDRYEIRRAQKEQVRCEFFSANDIKHRTDLLDEFENTYNHMFEDKNMKTRFNRKLVERYMSMDAIYFTIGFYDHVPYVFHSYIYDSSSKQVRFFYSCSPYRREKELSNLIGRINKLLHWQDMCHFKDQSILLYDWGGVSSLDNPNGIDKFKMGFGGDPVSYYNVLTSNGFWTRKLLILAKRLRVL